MHTHIPQRQTKNLLLLEIEKNKNENQQNSNDTLKWIEYRKNPWIIFPNYNANVDEVLNTAQSLLDKFSSTVIPHQHIESEYVELKNKIDSGQYKYSNKQENFQFSFNLISSVILFSIMFIGILVFKPFDNSSILLPGVILLACFAFNVLIPLPLSKYLTNKKQHKEDLQTLKTLQDKLGKFHIAFEKLDKAYQQNSRKILQNNEKINIKNYLHKNYYCEIPQLNMLVANIIDKNYSSKKAFLSCDIYTDFRNKEKITSNHHLDIFMHIKHIVAENTRHIISNKIPTHTNNFTHSNKNITHRASFSKKVRFPAKPNVKVNSTSEEQRWERFENPEEWNSFGSEKEWATF